MEYFVPQNELERQDLAFLEKEAGKLSSSIRGYRSKEERANFLRQFKDPLVMTVLLFGKENEDYETCEAAKAVLEERNIQYKS